MSARFAEALDNGLRPFRGEFDEGIEKARHQHRANQPMRDFAQISTTKEHRDEIPNELDCCEQEQEPYRVAFEAAGPLTRRVYDQVQQTLHRRVGLGQISALCKRGPREKGQENPGQTEEQ